MMIYGNLTNGENQMKFEEYFDTKNIKGAKQYIVAGYIAKVLQEFCSQNAEFKQSVEQSSDSFQQCYVTIDHRHQK